MNNVMNSIEALGISKVYWDGQRQLEVLKGVSLSVKAGEGVALYGPSGSGKTTLLNILSGLDAPTGGSVAVGGTDLSALNDGQKADFRNKNIGFVFQFYHLLPEFTALENVMLPALMRRTADKKEVRRKAEELLARVGLKERLHHFPGELSGGEQQRAAIARALVNDPQILFCDEPTGNLDRNTGAEVADILKGFFSDRRKTVVMVTHDEHLARSADRVWDMVRNDWMELLPA